MPQSGGADDGKPGRTVVGPGVGGPRVPLLPARYTLDDLLGTGAMGEVWRVVDGVLDRRVAMKITFATSPEAQERFRAEAKILARLEHPSIVPLYDLGALADGRLWFTMREVPFRTLWELISEVHAASRGGRWGVTSSDWSLHRLILAMLQVCEAVAHAHAVGIAHLDLKPNNVLIGAFGEVQVADWGISRFAAPGGATDASGGTPPYMPPEQALNEPGRDEMLCDVYAIGCMLYNVLAGRPPDSAISARMNGRAAELPLATLPMPDEIVATMRACMASAPEDRPRSAAEVASRLRAWVDGSERRGRADALVAEASEFLAGAEADRAAADRVRGVADRVLERVPPYAAVHVKRPGWALERRAARLVVQAESREADAIERLHTALALDPTHAVARSRLGDRYLERLEDADARRDTVQVTRVGAQLRGLQPERWERWSREGGILTLLTDPPGATATLYRYEEHDRQLVPRPYAELGRTPVASVRLPAGSWLVELNAEGHEPVRYPVNLRRGDIWNLTPPGETQPRPIALPPAGKLGPDDLYVPAGWFTCGTTDAVPDAMRPRKVWVDGFLVRRHPVTVGEYLRFLNDLLAQGREAEAMACRPVYPGGGADPWRERIRRLDPGGFGLNPEATGRSHSDDLPIVMIDWYGATTYAGWETARTGRTWRLPHELEWEKAARGVDGRIYPWGDEFDAALTNMMASHAGPPRLTSVHAFPQDVSPYLVRGMAGNVRELCATAWSRHGDTLPGAMVAPIEPVAAPPHRIVRGGSYPSAPPHCRVDARFGAADGFRLTVAGFRLVSSW